jgi:hypothetical protein
MVMMVEVTIKERGGSHRHFYSLVTESTVSNNCGTV